jgi:hypothetical protein
MLDPAVPALRSRWTSLRSAVRGEHAAAPSAPGRRGLYTCLGLVWLLDAALQYQPFMFQPSFVTQAVQPAIAGNPAVVANSATWASQVMLQHIAVYNAVFATIQLLIAAGFFFRRTLRAALAASIVWALFVWWFGESLGGILTGASPFTGVPGGVVLYALIAVLLWPAARTPAPQPFSPATSGPLGATAANLLWLALWGSFAYYLLLPGNRAPDRIGQVFSVTDAQPGWLTALMNGLSSLAGHRGTEISIVIAAACALVALSAFVPSVIRPALVVAAGLGLLFWIAEGLGGIFTGQGTDPNTGLPLILLAACFWPHGLRATETPAVPAARSVPHGHRRRHE